jgi:hypothetical protein
MKFAPITNSKIIGIAPDNTPLHSWNEGERTFIETWGVATSSSGTRYGLVMVVETTEHKAKPWTHNAPYNPQFLGAQPARVGEDY